MEAIIAAIGAKGKSPKIPPKREPIAGKRAIITQDSNCPWASPEYQYSKGQTGEAIGYCQDNPNFVVVIISNSNKDKSNYKRVQISHIAFPKK